MIRQEKMTQQELEAKLETINITNWCLQGVFMCLITGSLALLLGKGDIKRWAGLALLAFSLIYYLFIESSYGDEKKIYEKKLSTIKNDKMINERLDMPHICTILYLASATIFIIVYGCLYPPRPILIDTDVKTKIIVPLVIEEKQKFLIKKTPQIRDSCDYYFCYTTKGALDLIVSKTKSYGHENAIIVFGEVGEGGQRLIKTRRDGKWLIYLSSEKDIQN